MELYKQILKFPWKNKEPGDKISAPPGIKTQEFVLVKALLSKDKHIGQKDNIETSEIDVNIHGRLSSYKSVQHQL